MWLRIRLAKTEFDWTLKRVGHISFAGYENIPIVNESGECRHLIGERLAQTAPLAIVYFDNVANGTRHVLLFTDSLKVDLGVIAERYDGYGGKTFGAFILPLSEVDASTNFDVSLDKLVLNTDLDGFDTVSS